MNIKCSFPPNIEEIAASLPGALTPGVIFCYGDTIYNPFNVRISTHLRAHEAVHSSRQGKTDEEIRAWWRKYVFDAKFRLEEEVPAHQAEYASFRRQEKDAQLRFQFLITLAKRLSGLMYGQIVTFNEAKLLIKGNLCHSV